MTSTADLQTPAEFGPEGLLSPSVVVEPDPMDVDIRVAANRLREITRISRSHAPREDPSSA